MIPRTGFCAGSCWFAFVLDLLLGPRALLQDLSFWQSILFRSEGNSWMVSDCPLSPHPIYPLPCASLPAPLGPSPDYGLNDNWGCLTSFSPSLAHLPTHAISQACLQSLLLAEGAGLGTKSVGGPQSRCQVSAPFISPVPAHTASPHALTYGMHNFNSLLRNSSVLFFFLLLLFTFPISLRIPMAIFSFSSEISVLKYLLWGKGGTRIP